MKASKKGPEYCEQRDNYCYPGEDEMPRADTIPCEAVDRPIQATCKNETQTMRMVIKNQNALYLFVCGACWR